jgi:hypothetical protein
MYLEEILLFYDKKFSYNFLSCANVGDVDLYSTYAQPFTKVVWIFGLVACTAMAVVFKYLYHRKVYVVETVVMVIGILLEQGIGQSKKLTISNRVRRILIILLFTYLILTNTYRGKITTDLIAPLLKPRIETTEEAFKLGFKILLPVYKHHFAFTSILNMEKVPENNRISAWLETVHTDVPLIRKMAVELRNDENVTARIYAKFLRNLFFQPFERVPQNYSFVNEFLKCHKSIYVSEQLKLEELLLELSLSHDVGDFYFGKSEYLSIRQYWTMTPMHWDRFGLFQMQFHAMHQSGIPIYLENIYLKKSKVNVVKAMTKIIVGPLNLDGKFMSIFVICSWCVVLCLAIFLLEYLYYGVAKHHRCYRNS